MKLILSDEVEARLFGFEAFVDLWWVSSFTSSLTDKSGQPVCIADARWFFYRTRHIVIGVAELISEEFDLIRAFLDSVIEHCESSRGSHTLTSGNRHEVEFVRVLVSNT